MTSLCPSSLYFSGHNPAFWAAMAVLPSVLSQIHEQPAGRTGCLTLLQLRWSCTCRLAGGTDLTDLHEALKPSPPAQAFLPPWGWEEKALV